MPRLPRSLYLDYSCQMEIFVAAPTKPLYPGDGTNNLALRHFLFGSPGGVPRLGDICVHICLLHVGQPHPNRDRSLHKPWRKACALDITYHP